MCRCSLDRSERKLNVWIVVLCALAIAAWISVFRIAVRGGWLW
jgi:hypothetical protein